MWIIFITQCLSSLWPNCQILFNFSAKIPCEYPVLPEDFPINRDLGPAKSPLNIPIIMHWLKKYERDCPNRHNDVEFLRQGILHGFSLATRDDLKPYEFENNLSARVRPKEVWALLAKEVGNGRMAGPYFQTSPIDQQRYNPLGMAPKPHNRWRLVEDLSRFDDEGLSINSCVADKDKKVKYTEFNEIIEKIAQLPAGALIFKMDVRDAFKILRLHSSMFRLTGIKFGQWVMINKVLPFGGSVCCQIFERFSSFLNWIYCKVTNYDLIFHYLDDYMSAASPAPSEQAHHLMQKIRDISDSIGVPMHPDKCEGPCTNLTFLGHGVDTVKQEVYAPMDKVQKALHGISLLLSRDKVKVQLVMSTVGLLSFLTRAISPGRPFLHRTYKSIRGKKKSQFCYLNKETKKDLLAWKQFLKFYNGTSYMIQDDGTQGRSFMLYSDACTSHGAAVWSGKFQEFVYIKWPDSVINGVDNNGKKISTCLLELIPVVYAFFVPKWGAHFRNRMVTVFCDNKSTCFVLSKMSSKVSAISAWLRPLALRLMFLNVKLIPHFVPSSSQLADSLSRGRFDIFYSQIGPGQKQIQAYPHGLPPLESLTKN